MKNKITVFKIAIMLGIAIFAFTAVSCNDPKPTTPTQRTMSNGITIVKGDAGITQKQLDDMVAILNTMYEAFSPTMKTNFDTNVETAHIKANDTAINHSGKTLTIAANSTGGSIYTYLSSNSLVMQFMNNFKLA